MVSRRTLLLVAASIASHVASARPSHRHRRALDTVFENCNTGLAFTFDDGPYIWENAFSDNFTDVGGKTTFFINGNNWGCIYDEENVARLRHAFAAGHQIAHHTWSHPYLTQLTEPEIDTEITRLDTAFEKILGIRPNYLRPPFGDINDAVATYIQTTHQKTIVLWSDDSRDSTGVATTEEVLDFYLGIAADSSLTSRMTLSHEVQKVTYETLQQSVQALAGAGYQLLTVSDCLGNVVPAYTVVGEPQERDETWSCQYVPTPSTPTSTSSAASSTSSGAQPTATSGTCSASYTVASGEYCWLIANDAGLTVEELLTLNPGVDCEDLQVGDVLCLVAGAAPITSVPNTVSSTTTSDAPSTTSPAGSCGSAHTVESGEYCWLIATNAGLTVDELLAFNPGVDCDDLQIGDVLCLSGGGSSPPSSIAPPVSGTATSSAPATTTSSAPGTCSSSHTVASGEYCWLIANDNGLSMDELLSLNPALDCDALQPGDVLCLN